VMSEALFVGLLWKSMLVCAGVLAVLKAARNHSPAQRAAALIVGIGLLALLPLLSLLLPPLQMHTAAAPIAELPIDVSAALAQAPATVSAAPQTAPPSLSSAQLILMLWLAGALVVLGRLAGGILTLRSWTAQAEPLDRPEASIYASGVKLLVTDAVDAPLSWGLRSPTILLTPETLADPRDAEAVIAHELAHIRRRDWLALLLARAVVALYWFNPLVWLIERAFLHEAEQAADAEALRSIEPAHYAGTLLKLAAGQRVPAAANSIAAGGLKRRILLIVAGREARPAAQWKVIATYAGLALALPVAAIEFVPQAKALVPGVAHVTAPLMGSTAFEPALMTMTSPAASAVTYPPRPSLNHHWRSAQARMPYAGGLRQEAIDRGRTTEQMVRDVQQRAAEAQRRVGDVQLRVQEAQQRSVEAMARAAEAMQRSAAAMQHVAIDMSVGADRMDSGAERMLHGAQQMRDEAVRLRDPAYRQRKIAEQAAEGHPVTDQQLIDSIPQLQKGADDMVRGAADMRRGAEQMRHSGREQ
jgi:beta-lactamase regulating signal transducer with metallopeptidase domain